MIKSELVQRIAEHNPHLYQRDVENIVNAILDEIVAALARGRGQCEKNVADRVPLNQVRQTLRRVDPQSVDVRIIQGTVIVEEADDFKFVAGFNRGGKLAARGA